MRILATCPGRHGDILWTLPALRALHRATGVAIDLGVAPKYAGICPLADAQPYLTDSYPLAGWQVEETAPMTPWQPPVLPEGYDRVIHLGYRGWPMQPFPYEHYWRMVEQLPPELIPKRRLDLSPWLTRQPYAPSDQPIVAVGFTDEWLELKAGVLLALAHRFRDVTFFLLVPWQPSRWTREYGHSWPKNVAVCPCDLLNVARLVSAATVMLGCNSVQSHIATGLGVPVVMLEPASARHHPIFYPHGKDGPEVTLVKGNDGEPTFDARHVGDALAAQLESR